MNGISCEQVRMAAMAAADGCRSDLSPDRIDAHLAGCAECRQEVGRLETLAALLGGQKRRAQAGDIWPSVAAQLLLVEPDRAAAFTRRAFIFLGLSLLGYKLVEMVSDHDFGLYIKIVPVLLVIAVFVYLKENPFKINAELRLEGE